MTNNYKIKTLNDIAIGAIKVHEHILTGEEIQNFAQLTHDSNPLHTDVDFGRQTWFGDINAQGQLMTSFVIGVVGSDLPGVGWYCLGVNADFISPGYAKDELFITVKVVRKVEALQVLLLEGEVVNKATGKVLVRCQIKTKFIGEK